MEGQGVIVNNLLVRHGQFIKVKGFIAEDCTDFAINLGKDPENLLLHFNPRFDLSGVTNKIFCNSRENGVWGEEQSEDLFPFQKGSDATVSVRFERERFVLLLPSGTWFSFQVRFSMDVISYLSLKNFALKCLSIE